MKSDKLKKVVELSGDTDLDHGEYLRHLTLHSTSIEEPEEENPVEPQKKHDKCNHDAEHDLHLEEVRRMPLTPPKQDMATDTGMMNAM